MNYRMLFIVVAGAMVLLAGCSGDQPVGRIEITPPAADLTFDEAFVKDRDIHFQMPEDFVLGQVGPTVVNAKGELIVLEPTQHFVFQMDAKGNYLRPIGARGGAEGEYFYVLKMLLAPNGDLYIYSVGESKKFIVLSGDSYAFKREIPDPNPMLIDHIVITDGGHIYGSQVDIIDGGSAGAQEEGTHALFRLDDHFGKVASFYPVEDKRTGRALNRFHNTVLTPKRGGGFYFMYPTTYEIRQYSEQGALEQTLFSTYRSKCRNGIEPLPPGLNATDWTSKHKEWFAEHISPFNLFECGDLLVLEQTNQTVSGEWEGYLNLLYKDGRSVADGVRVPANHNLLTVAGSELYFSVEGAFDEATGEVGDPYMAVYRLAQRQSQPSTRRLISEVHAEEEGELNADEQVKGQASVNNKGSETGAVGTERVVALPGGVEMEFVWIEQGIFEMGSPPSERRGLIFDKSPEEGPVHEVEISTGFWLGKYEVTQGQWEAVMGTTPWRENGNDKELVRSDSSHPAVHISWHDVQVFIDRLNGAAGEEVYRLPTEAEWEYACRAGTATRYSFGDDENQLIHYSWTRENSWTRNEQYAHAVGQKRPNPWGVRDMHGNVWEWVQDWYAEDYYEHSPRVDPTGPPTGSKRVARGGDFSDPTRYLRAATRLSRDPDKRGPFIGVRLLRVSQGSQSQ